MTLVLFEALVLLPLLVETGVSVRHERALRARGAVEPRGDVYLAMLLAYPGSFLSMFAEGANRGIAADGLFAAGVGLFVLAKALKYWAIASLGERWTFRVLVPPGARSIVSGPYRWLSHPNYVAVAGEIAGIALATRAAVTGPIAFAVFGWLMLRRIKVEEAALARR